MSPSNGGRYLLVSSRIAVELTPRMRTYLGVKALDTPRLEALLEENLDMIARVNLTVSERETVLRDRPSSDSLLRRLPIHVRSDGSIGDLENVFLEDEWRIPPSLRKHVLTVRLCDDADASSRQQSLVAAWFPEKQVETALSRPNPHRLRNDILDALANLSNNKSELKPQLSPRLARNSLARRAGYPPWHPRTCWRFQLRSMKKPGHCCSKTIEILFSGHPKSCHIDIREHPGFAYLETHVLPDRRSSFETLALMIEHMVIVGRIGEADGYPMDDFAVLANFGADLKLPGWPLLAAVLTTLTDDHGLGAKIVEAFSELSDVDADLAAGHLDALAGIAISQARHSAAARRAYLRGFEVVAEWPEDARRRVFGGTRVPTKIGRWRSGARVIENGNGIALTHLLAPEFASRLPSHERLPLQVPNPSDGPGIPLEGASDRREVEDVDLAELEAQSAVQQREFLRPWHGHIPSDLVIVYLGLIGRYPRL